MIPKIGSYIIRIDELDSTNKYASSILSEKKPPEGTIVIADRQSEGRGQASNKWESEPYKNLTFSIIIYPSFVEVANQFEISKAISLGIADFLINHTEEVTIKWPNDLYIGKKKIAGILMEYAIQGKKFSSCIVGIGLNINQNKFISDAPNPVSLTQISGIEYNLDECLSCLLDKINSRYSDLRYSRYTKIDSDYQNLLFQKDIWCTYSDEKGEFEGKILGVDGNGLLMIETREGEIRSYDYKEVAFLM